MSYNPFMWMFFLGIVLTALLSSVLTLALGYWWFERYLKDEILEHVDRHVDETIAELGREVEIRVKQGVVDGVASLPSSEVLAGATRTAARSGADLVSTLLTGGRRPRRSDP